MKRVITFNAPGVTSDNIRGVLAPVRGMPGVKGLELLHAETGSPQYIAILDVEAGADAALEQFIEGARASFAGAYTSFKSRAFEKLL